MTFGIPRTILALSVGLVHGRILDPYTAASAGVLVMRVHICNTNHKGGA